jgi:formate dehydrogenase major subunit
MKDNNMSEKIAYLNDKAYQIENGETIIDFARRQNGKNAIPTLCDVQNLKPFGSCRVCSVDVALEKGGQTKTLASCHTPVSEGMYIYTDSENVQRLRKNVVELVLTDHPLDCLTCEVNGNCELQTVAARVGIRDIRYPKGANHLERQKDLSHPYMTSDLSKCINCYRCVRACDEIQGQFVLSMSGRGFESKIIKGLDSSFMDSDCVSCGACAQACPTSAISDVFESKSVRNAEKTRTICTYCGVGCNLDVSKVGNKIVSIQSPLNAEANGGHTCLKGRYAFNFYDHEDRLRNPMIRKNGVLVETTWDETYDYIARKLNSIKAEHGADSIAAISSARCTNEENYLMQKFVRAVIGTNNIDGCARICHSPTALGMQRVFGTGAATNSIEDIAHTDCVLIIGANPTDAHPVTGAKLKQHAMGGKTTIVIDPRKTEMAKYATLHLPLRPGTNVAVLNMIMYYIISEKLADLSFIADRTEGFAPFYESLEKIDLSEMERVSGISRELAKEAARLYATAPNAMSFHGLGVTEHSQGTFAVMQIADLALLTGNIGRKGVGVNPLRGQNNVQGSADMGVQPHQGAGYLDITKPDIISQYEDFYGVSMPHHIGYKIPEMFNASIEGKLKALWIIGEDVVQTDPNTQHVIKALQSTELLIVQELFMTETAKYADVILPGASFLEKDGTFTNGERRVQKVNKIVEPIGNAKADGQIIIDIMNKMGYEQADYSAETMLDEISQIVPFFAGITWDNLGENGKQWPVAKDGTDTQILHTESFKRGLGYFEFNPFRETNEIISNSEDYPFILTTNRRLEHYNCGAMTRRTGNVIINPEDVLLINPSDAESNLINDGDFVCVESPRGKVDIKAKITDEVKSGILSSTFHFPEIMLNNVTSNESDSEALCPEYKVVAVRIRKSKGRHKLEKM